MFIIIIIIMIIIVPTVTCFIKLG